MNATYPTAPVLVVDDEIPFLRALSLTLQAEGIDNVIRCKDSRVVMDLMSNREISVVALDVNMPHVTGAEILTRLSSEHPQTPVVMLTGVNQVETAVECMKAGALDYHVKGCDPEGFLDAIRRGIETWELRRESRALRKRMAGGFLSRPDAFSRFITKDEKALEVLQYVEAVAQTSEPVLITGESGVGKELIAEAVHTLSDRRGRFVTVNVAGLDDSVFSDTLFGHRKGAFTGAVGVRRGLVEEASRGTLFLDEIGDLSQASQVKLLRLIQEREYMPLGSDTVRRTDARIVVATHQSLQARQEAGQFRADLYFRLRAHRVDLPPLRERRDDLAPLIAHFMEDASRELGKDKPTAPKEMLDLLGTYHFPGNVRELRSMIYDAVSVHKSGQLSLRVFRERIREVRDRPVFEPGRSPGTPRLPLAFGDSLPTLKKAAELLIGEAMDRSSRNQSVAADMLGITRQALNRRLNRVRPG